MKVIGYIRVSTQGQARDGYSLAYQEDEWNVNTKLDKNYVGCCLNSIGVK